jgi:hypothetical protein
MTCGCACACVCACATTCACASVCKGSRQSLAGVYGTEARDVRPRPGHDLWVRVRGGARGRSRQSLDACVRSRAAACLRTHARTHPRTHLPTHPSTLLAHARTHAPIHTHAPASRRSCPGTGVRSTTRRTRPRGADRRQPQRPCASPGAPGRPGGTGRVVGACRKWCCCWKRAGHVCGPGRPCKAGTS